MNRYYQFEKFYFEKLAKRPWDHENHPCGFKPEDPNSNKSSDISGHLPILRYFGRRCKTIVELGTRNCDSTSSFIAGMGDTYGRSGTVYSFDMCTTPSIYELIGLEKQGLLPCQWRFAQQNTIADGFEIPECDLLFLDTLHTYDQVKKELEQHGHKAMDYLIFHDTYSQGEKSIDRKDEVGILPAIREYTAQNNWQLIYDVIWNHGLRVYSKIEHPQ